MRHIDKTIKNGSWKFVPNTGLILWLTFMITGSKGQEDQEIFKLMDLCQLTIDNFFFLIKRYFVEMKVNLVWLDT